KIMQSKLSDIKQIEYYTPDSGLYFFVDFSKYGNDILLAEKILEYANVITVPGSAFGENGKGFLRLSFGAEPEKIIIGLEKIKKYLETI
ncbi:MAG TPA: aminotransferase class I/II-fold pyridoxal phosphate-dependent enzyme, partial [Candidatus Paceibacterota bacterium]|nr:aminotransferase class I/II-fold pyridoxal phosphate-dependent enzyme [Candidatus Paceibacterota bacterium]